MTLYNELIKYFSEERIKTVLSSNKFIKLGDRVKKGKFKETVDLTLCKKLYKEYNMPFYKIAMLYGVSDVTLREYLLKEKIISRGHNTSPDDKNNFFSKINSCSKAYFLGLITADGNICNKNNKKIMQISLTEEDTYILKKFKDSAKLSKEPKIYVRNRQTRIEKYSHLYVTSKKIFDDLNKWGIYPNKSHLDISMPNIDKKFISHFIRGYFDGDGIAYKNGNIGFCGSKTLITQIRDYFINELNVNNIKVSFNKQNKIYYITWGSVKDLIKIYNNMYKNCKDLFLTRKRNKIINGLKPRGVKIR